MNTTVLYCSCFEPVISFRTYRIIPWHIIGAIDHTKWSQMQLLVVIIRLLLYVLQLFPLTHTGFIKLITFVIHRVHWPHFITMYIIHIHSSFISWLIVTKHLAGLLLGRGRVSQELSLAWASWVGKLGHRPCSILITHLAAN